MHSIRPRTGHEGPKGEQKHSSTYACVTATGPKLKNEEAEGEEEGGCFILLFGSFSSY